MFCSRILRAQPFIYLLSQDPENNFRIFHRFQVPLPNFGFLACGVYQRSTHPVSRMTRLCGTFTADIPSHNALGIRAAVRITSARAYCFIRHKHYGQSQPVRAWTFLYLQI